MDNNAYVVFKAAGKQFKVSQGSRIAIDRLSGENAKLKAGDTISFDQVIMATSGNDTKLGKPLLSGIKVHAKVLGHRRSPKVIIYKKKRRTGYTKKQGHRQDQTNLEIERIEGI